MEEITSLITSSSWWFSVVFVASVVQLINRKLAGIIDSFFEKRSHLKSKRRKIYEIERNKTLEPIINSETLQKKGIILSDHWARQSATLLNLSLFFMISLDILRLKSLVLGTEIPMNIPNTIIWTISISMFFIALLLMQISAYRRRLVIDALNKIIDRDNE